MNPTQNRYMFTTAFLAIAAAIGYSIYAGKEGREHALPPMEGTSSAASERADEPDGKLATALLDDTPLAPIEKQLATEALRGNAQSACKLAQAYTDCLGFPQLESDFRIWLAEREQVARTRSPSISTRVKPSIANFEIPDEFVESFNREFTERSARVEELSKWCANFPGASESRSIEFWRIAATNRNPRGLKVYASGEAFNGINILENHSALQQFKSLAPSLLWADAERGSVSSILLLAEAYSPVPRRYRNLLSQAVQPDAPTSLALYRLAVRRLQETGADQLIVDRIMRSSERAEMHATDAEKEQAATRERSILNQWIAARSTDTPDANPESMSAEVAQCE